MDPVNVIYDLIEREGGFVNNPADRGGPTKHGITQTTLSEWRGVPATLEDVKNLTEDEAYCIYESKFFKQTNIDQIPDPKTRTHLLDAAALHGPVNAATWLQEAVGSKPDGFIGQRTLHDVAHYIDRGGSWKEINNHVVKQRLKLVRNLAKKDPSQEQFLRDWERRIIKFKR